jgi:signal transduction histidine kinase
MVIGQRRRTRVTEMCRALFQEALRVPEAASADPAVAMHVRRLNAFMLIVAPLVIALAAKRFSAGARIAATIEMSAVGLMQVLRLLMLRNFTVRKFQFIASASIALGMWIIVGTALVLGQLGSPSLLCIGLLPLAGGYFKGAKGALRWGCAGLACVALVGLTQVFVAIPPEVPRTEIDLIDAALIILLAATAFAYTAQRGSDAHLRELHERADRIRWQAAALTVARDAALEASRIKSTFLANTSHEIRTPMNVIIGMTDMALDSKLEPDARDYLQRVRAASLGLLGIINDILDLSRIEAGKMKIEAAQFELRATVDELMTLLTPSAAAKGVALVARLDRAVPAVVCGDAVRLRQVLTNLVGNGIKFTDRGAVTLELNIVRATPSRDEILFTVRDTGIGISPDRQAAVFESFTQADDGTTRRFGGTGLGLTISRQLVELMGGTLGLESTVGQGSTFRFSLAFGVPADSASATPSPDAAAPAPLQPST